MRNNIQRQQLYEVVMERIRADIVGGRLKAGDRLETVRELAQRFGVGQSSVREAVRVLSYMGLLRVKHGGGIFVTTQASQQGTPDIGTVLAEGARRSLRHLLELRLALEPMAARLAAVRATPQECQEIQRRCDQVQEIHHLNLKVFEEQTASQERISQEEDVLFHMAIARAAHNPFLLEALEQVHAQLHESRRITWRVPQLVESALRFHPQITESILAHDALRAESFMRAHLDDVVWWLEMYDAERQTEREEGHLPAVGSEGQTVQPHDKGLLATEFTVPSPPTEY